MPDLIHARNRDGLTTECQPIPEWVGGPRQHEGHVGVHLGDPRGPGLWTITVDGEDVGATCREALGGPDGWVVLTHGRIHVSPWAKDEVCVLVRHGDVRISYHPEAIYA